MIPLGRTVRKGKVILLVLFFLLSIKSAYAETIIPTASITLDGNPGEWGSIDPVYIDAQGDDNTDYTGADIKSFKFAQDSNYVYVIADFYDGAPNEALGQAESFAYQFHFAKAGTHGAGPSDHIDSLGVFYDGSQWDINYLSLMDGDVSGSLVGSSVTVDSVIELQIPKNKLPDSFDFCLQVGTGLGIDGVLGDVTEWKTLYCVAPEEDNISIRQINPTPGTIFTVGQQVTFTGVVDYTLISRPTADIYVMFGEREPCPTCPEGYATCYDVMKVQNITQGSGSINFTFSATIREDACAEYPEKATHAVVYVDIEWEKEPGVHPVLAKDEVLYPIEEAPTDNPPTIEIISPSDGETVSGTVRFQTYATDDHGLEKVEFYIDDELKVTHGPFGPDTVASTCNWDCDTTPGSITYIPNGSHTFNAKVYDTAGQTSTDTISFIVHNVVVPNLLKKYAPVLYLHPEEEFYPWGIKSMLDKAELWEDKLIDEKVEGIDPPISPTKLTSEYNDKKYYLNLQGYDPSGPIPPKEVWKNDTNYSGKYFVYGRQYESPGAFILQYWFFYPFNDWDSGAPQYPGNHHEGDWEMTQVCYLKNIKKPGVLTCSYHQSGASHNWDDEVSKIEETHPKVFIGKGGHGCWASSGDHPVGEVWRILEVVPILQHLTLQDFTSENGLVLYPESVNPSLIPGESKKSYKLIDISEGNPWKNWPGKWGDIFLHPPGFKGPESPGQQDKWNNPIEWGSNPPQNWIHAWLGSPAHLHIYDPYGNHVGFTETGEIEATIPGTYLYIPSSYTETSEELVWIYTSENIRFVIEATSPGTFDFTFSKYLEEEDQLIGLGYKDVEVAKDTVATVDVSPKNPEYLMEIDLDGDGTIDKIIKPTIIEEAPSPPAPSPVPTGSIVINNGAEYTNSRNVTLSLKATNASQMCFSNDKSSWSKWENYATSKSWTLTSGDGTKTIYVKFKNAGGVSEIYSDDIILDTTPPTTTLIDCPTETVTGNTPKVPVTFTWTGSDNITPIESLIYQYKLEGYAEYEDWTDWTSETTEIYLLPSGNYTFKVRAKDEAGNYPEEDDEATAKCSFTVSLPIIIYPNPCYLNKGQRITMANLPLTSEIKVHIYDLGGNIVRTLGESDVSIEGGSKTATWDCRNDNGEVITRDIYIYFIPSATEKKTGKIAIIK